MSKFTEYSGSQFGNPRGFVGSVCCLIMNTINKKMYRKTVELMQQSGIDPADKILDIGYGNGYFLQQADRKCGAELYGIDISADMKTTAERRNRGAKEAGRLHLEIGDCCDLPYEDEMFAAAASINTVYFWEDTVQGLSEIRRVLKPGASFYNVVYTKEWLDALSYTEKGFQKFEPEELIELGKHAGFAEARVEEIVSGKSFAVIYRKI